MKAAKNVSGDLQLRPSLRDAKRDLTRSLIRKAARESIHAYGVAQSSMDDMASRSGMSRANIYLHYGTKDAVLADLIAEDWKGVENIYRRFAATTPMDRVAVRRWLSRVVSETCSHQDSLAVFAYVNFADPSFQVSHFQERERLIDILAETIDAFRVRATANQPVSRARLACHLMISKVEQLCTMAAQNNPVFDIDTGIDLVTDDFLAFIGGSTTSGRPARPGRRLRSL